MGGSATLWIGGLSESEIEARKATAEATADAMRAAVREMACCLAVDCHTWHVAIVFSPRLNGAADPDERAAYRILYEALAEPARAIYENAGYEPGDDSWRGWRRRAIGAGFDVLSGRLVDNGGLARWRRDSKDGAEECGADRGLGADD